MEAKSKFVTRARAQRGEIRSILRQSDSGNQRDPIVGWCCDHPPTGECDITPSPENDIACIASLSHATRTTLLAVVGAPLKKSDLIRRNSATLGLNSRIARFNSYE